MGKNKWKETGTGNVILNGDGFHISYNPDTAQAHNGAGGSLTALGNLVAHLGSIPVVLTDGAETALVVPRGEENSFYILKGDWRAGYEELVEKGLDACLAFYRENIEHRSDWSTDVPLDPKPSV